MKLSAPQWVFVVSLLLAATIDFCLDGNSEWTSALLGWSVLPVAADVALRYVFALLKVNLQVSKQIHLTLWWFSTALLYMVLGFPYLLPLVLVGLCFLLYSLFCLFHALYLSVRLWSSRWRT